MSTIKTTIKSISPAPLSRIFVRKIFSTLLAKHLWRSLIWVKFHAFSIFFWTPLDGSFEVWELFFERRLILDIQTTFRLETFAKCEKFRGHKLFWSMISFKNIREQILLRVATFEKFCKYKLSRVTSLQIMKLKRK